MKVPRVSLRRQVLPLGLLLLVAGTPVRDAALAAGDDRPTVAEFIAVVRGYDVATIRRTFPAYNVGLFEQVFGAGAPIPLATERERAMFTGEQAVRTPAGVVIDIGHVVTGLEAAAPLPPMARAVEAATGCSMRASVTWSGDVGQALADYVLAGGTGDPAPFYEENAPPEDLLGDIDGYVLGAEFGGASIDVAAVLTRAYLAGDLEATRFRRFVALLGDDPRATAAREITCYTGAFARLTGAQIDPTRLAEAAPYFIDRFMALLDAGLRAETGTAGG
jgi:hypothetical protein